MGARWATDENETLFVVCLPGIDFDNIPGPAKKLHAVKTDESSIAKLLETLAEKLEVTPEPPSSYSTILKRLVNYRRAEPSVIVNEVAGVSNPPANSLKIRREFTDRDRDDFVDATFEEIARFFETSLTELETQNPGVETRYSRADARHFKAVVYRHGKKQAACRVWLPGRDHFAGDVAYAADDRGNDNTMNEWLSIEDNGYTMVVKPGLSSFQSNEGVSQEGAAEYLWSLLIGRLQ